MNLAVVLPCAALLAFGAFASPGDPKDVYYVDASLDIDGRLLSWRFLDLQGDGTNELVLAVRTPSGERELRVHALEGSRLATSPRLVIPVLKDILAWGVADVRAEPGKELVFLTRGAAWSYSPTLSGYRDNVAKLAELEMIYDVPDPSALPFWAYVLPTGGGDLLLLPGRGGASIWGPAEGGAYAQRALLAASVRETDEPELDPEDREKRDRRRRRAGLNGSTPFLGSSDVETSTLLEDARSYDAPALVDYDGDGRLDLIRREKDTLHFHRGTADGPPAIPTRSEELPEELTAEDQEVLLRLADLDGDGRIDLLAQVFDEVDSFENIQHRLLIYRATRDRLLADEPDQVLRFEAGPLVVELADVDGDGRIDLVIRKLELPSLLGAVTGLEFTFGHVVFPGEKGRFARKPTLREETTYSEDEIADVIANRELLLDCDGDDIADLVEIDLKGNVAIRRLQKESSFLRGDTWSLETSPWKRFELEGSADSLTVDDFNDDGLGDIVSATRERLTVLLSARRGGGR